MKVKKEHVEGGKKMENTEKLAIKSLDSIVFNCFKNLTSATETERLDACMQLLQHFSKNQEKVKKEKESQYILRRLIRGVGASTTSSRAGFFTALVGFLKIAQSEDVNVEKVLETVKKELHVGSTVANKEDADAIVGQILVCGALLRSQIIYKASGEYIFRLTDILIASSKHRSYHSSLAYSFLVELLKNIDEGQFTTYVWPSLEIELKKSWDKQTINTLHCLIVIATRFKNVITKKYFKVNFGGNQLLNSESYEHLMKIFWENTSMSIVTHPAVESFAKYLAGCKLLEEFWTNYVEKCLSHPIKLREIVTIKMFTDILESADPNKLQVSKFLGCNFIQMMVASLKGLKLKKDETLKAFYDEFFEALSKFSTKVNDDIEKVEIIHKLILHPGTLGIEKYTTHRIIHQIIANLGENGIQRLFETYKNIFLNKLCKNAENSEETWLNVERQNAGYMLHSLICHKKVQTSFEWRTEQLKFMMSYALFHVNDDGDIIKQKENSITITNDFAGQLKGIFYTSLQSKLPRLTDEKSMLLSLVKVCNDVLQHKNFNKYLRNHINDKVLKAWNEMYSEVHKIKKKETSKDKLRLVFHILLLHMGLQLFREPEMAEAAILDLEKCMEKNKEKRIKINNQKEGDTEQEPEWIEVVIDLFLHLLSQNNSSLRNVVNSVFPHLCNNLTLTAMHQILSVLDMKDGQNPLSEHNENENDDDDDIDEHDVDNDEDEENETNLSDESSDENDEEIIEEEEEEGTETEKLRNAISVALGSVGKDADQDSIDLDDMDEDEGRRLDEALAEAFKIMKRPEQNKKSKGYRVKTTTVMHFRIRVLDMLEIYIQHEPSLVMCLEIMLSLYNMIEFCGDNELKPLSIKVDKVLSKLTSLRHFSSTEDITEKNICDFLRIIIEKKVKAQVFEVFSKLRAKCSIFLIACGKLLGNGKAEKEEIISSGIVEILSEYLNDFIKLRNPTVNIILLSNIFKMRWPGIWHLATILSQNGLNDRIRVFRRIQLLELLKLLYTNNELIRQGLQSEKKRLETIFKTIENCLQKHITSLADKDQQSIKEFTTILDVLFVAHRCHTRIPLESYFDKEKICNNIQSIRKKIKLDNLQSYSRFCTAFGLKIIKNSEVAKPNVVVLENGINDDISLEDEEEVVKVNHPDKRRKSKSSSQESAKIEISQKSGTEEHKNKRKIKSVKDPRREKKLRKEERLKVSSQGLNGGFSFVNGSIDAVLSDRGGMDSNASSD